MINILKSDKKILLIPLISFIIFIPKWIISYSFYPNEDFLLKIINESYQDSFMYFHYVKTLSDLNIFQSLAGSNFDNGIQILPIGSIIIHSIFFKFFGIFAFIFLEFLSICFFITIFYLIYKKFNFQILTCILLSLLTFNLPIIVNEINSILKIPEISTFAENFYNLRFPRPLIANLLLFYSFYITIVTKNYLDNKKNIFILTIILALSFSSFFFIFFTLAIYLIIIFILNYHNNKSINLKYFFYSIIKFFLIFLILVSPFIFLLLESNHDYLLRMGVINIDLEKKTFLLKHYYEKLTNYKLILIYIISLFFLFFIKKKFQRYYKIIFCSYMLFLSSIISPILFIIISTKISFLYHFNNLAVLTLFLYFFLLVIVLTSNFIKNFEKKKFFYYTLILFLSFGLFINNLPYVKKNKNDLIYDQTRKEQIKVLNKIKNNNNISLKKISLITFDPKIMTWLIFNDIQKLKILDGTIAKKNNDRIEKDMIDVLKFLNLNENDFYNFIKNKKVGYRYINHNMRMLFWQTYQANSLTTYKNSLDFDSKTLKFIKSSSPFYSHQFAIPNSEIERLLKNFKKNNSFKNTKADIIILDKESNILEKAKINESNFCKEFEGKYIKLYLNKKICQRRYQ